jgi:replicative DNA helicase
VTAPDRFSRRVGFSPPAPELHDQPDLSPREQRALMPDATVLMSDQVVEAQDLLLEDRSRYPRYPWRDLATLAGPMCPGELILIAARTGGGKSLFLQNLFDALIVAGRCGLYAGLEQSPQILRAKWACLRAGVDPRLVLAPRPDEEGRPHHVDAVKRVDAELTWQMTREIREAAHFSSSRRINAAGLRRWTDWAVNLGAEFVVVDHIDRIQHGDGKNAFHEVSETVRLAKELAVEHGIVMLVASQVGRPSDAVDAFMPPALHNLRGAGTKEEEADTVLGIYRPLRADITEKEIKRVRQGLANTDTITEPGQMGVRVLKHRLDGSAMGRSVRLDVFHGRLLDLEERHLYTTQRGERGQV